jgi:hypothetical protein
VRGDKKSRPVRRNVLDPGKLQRHWHLRDLSPGYRNLSSGLRVVTPIEIKPASVGSGNSLRAAVMGDLGVLDDSQRRQRAAQIPDCSGKTDDENDNPG